MVIHDDDVAFHRAAPHLGNEAPLPLAALLTGASVRAGIQLVPQQACLRQFRKLSAVARRSILFPGSNGTVLLDLFEAAQHRLISEVVKLLAAQVIVSALHVADREART